MMPLMYPWSGVSPQFYPPSPVCFAHLDDSESCSRGDAEPLPAVPEASYRDTRPFLLGKDHAILQVSEAL